MFKKLFARFGVGAATVDLRLDRDHVRLGETLTGTIHVAGGAVEQRIGELAVQVVVHVHVRGREVVRSVESIPVLRGFAVKPKPFAQEIPFSFHVPVEWAISSPAVHYSLRTVLDVEGGADPTDWDPVTVLPSRQVEQVFRALSLLDLRQKPGSGELSLHGQEFSFFPGRPLPIPLKELEVMFVGGPHDLRMLMELELFTGSVFCQHEEERKAELSLPAELLAEGREDELARFLLEWMERIAHEPHSVPFVSLHTPQGGYQHGHPYGYPHYDPQPYGHHGSGIAGMLGGMAAGLLGGILLDEAIREAGDVLDDVFDGDGNGFNFDGGDDSGFGDGGDWL